MNFSSHPDGFRRPAMGLALVLALHGLVGWALLNGTATRLVEKVSVIVPVALIAEVTVIPTSPPLPPPPQIVRSPPSAAELQKTVTPPPPTSPLVVEAAAADQASPAAITPVAPDAPLAPAQPSPAPGPVVVAPAPLVSLPAGKPAAQNIGVVCPKQVKPIMPRRAQQEGISGRVEALATVRGGRVVSVDIITAQPRGVFEAAVRQAMLQYRCEGSSEMDIRVPQEFNFSFEE